MRMSRDGSLRMARQKTESAIQPLMGFLRDNIDRVEPPHEHVIVFDEAQRAWDAAFGRRKFGRTASEAALFLDIMGRHPDWAVIVALVGSGQEINTGEAGLAAWGEALAERPEWHVRAAPGVLGGSRSTAASVRRAAGNDVRWTPRCIWMWRFVRSDPLPPRRGSMRCWPAMPRGRRRSPMRLVASRSC